MEELIINSQSNSQSASENSGKPEPRKTKNELKPQYLILGCGHTAVTIANRLRQDDRNVILVDINESRIDALRDQGFDGVTCDIGSEDLETVIGGMDISDLEAALILSPNTDANERALYTVKRLVPNAHVVSMASEPSEQERFETIGSDVVLLPYSVIADAAINVLERAESVRKARRLLKTVQAVGKKKLAIIAHDNPDPDAIASAMALQHIAKSVGVNAEILYHGDIGHQENRAFVNLLGVDANRINTFDANEYGKIALVDQISPRDSECFQHDMRVDIIIDHHPLTVKNLSAEFVDIRSDVGSTSTILSEYLQELEIEIDDKLSAALLYGIRTDTQGFKRNTNPADLTAAAFLYPLADHEILGRVETPSMSTGTLDVLGDAIKRRVVRGSYLISNVGFIVDRDALPQAADYLLNLEGIMTTVIFGISEEHIHVSGRNKDIRLDIGSLFNTAFGNMGSAGGHSTAAAAQIPLGVFSGIRERDTLMKLADEAILKRFLSALGVEQNEGKK